MSAMNLHAGFLERFPNDNQDLKNKMQFQLNRYIGKIYKTSTLLCSNSSIS